MKRDTIFLLAVLVVVLLFVGVTIITSLLRQPSDTAVLVGLLIGLAYVVGSYFLINYLLKKSNKNEKTNSNQ